MIQNLRLGRGCGFRLLPVCLLLLSLLFFGCQSGYESLDLAPYQYRDTKDLIRFVYDAAQKLQKDGVKGLDYLRDNRGLYLMSDRYLYVYEMDGTNVFHAGMPYLEGKNLLNSTDKDGKFVARMAFAAVDDKNNPHAWVHYTWWEPNRFYPVPKSSCHFKVITPEGRTLLVGGGIDYPLEEKEFIRIAVDSAAQEIREKGKAALPEIVHPAAKYNFRDVKVFAFTPAGQALISPVMSDNMNALSILDCVDEMGHKPFKEALAQIGDKETVWQVFLAKNRYERTLVKKALYVRKTSLDGQLVYVAAITDLPQPPG